MKTEIDKKRNISRTIREEEKIKKIRNERVREKVERKKFLFWSRKL
jgi:hypothetical protein